MQTKMKNKAQSILEYVVILGVISAALVAMQLYFKRGIQAVVKVAADEIGGQEEGSADYDYKYENKEKNASNISATTKSTNTIERGKGGVVTYVQEEIIQQQGVLSQGMQREE